VHEGISPHSLTTFEQMSKRRALRRQFLLQCTSPLLADIVAKVQNYLVIIFSP
jgi:hypothetical protein